MRFYLVRHAQPEEFDPDDEDPDPELTDEGKAAAQALGKWMVDKEEVPTVLYASPKVRTQQTAEIIAGAIEDAGLLRPEIETDVSIGPHMSIKGLVEQTLADESKVRVGIVTHHESLEHGLRVLGRQPWVHLDMFAQCELRIVKMKRKDGGDWEEHRRVEPSNLGGLDHY